MQIHTPFLLQDGLNSATPSKCGNQCFFVFSRSQCIPCFTYEKVKANEEIRAKAIPVAGRGGP
jgi:hypothetical protein